MIRGLFLSVVFASLNVSAQAFPIDLQPEFLPPVSRDLSELAITTLAKPADVDVSFSEADFETKPWVREFTYVVVVNKANEGADTQSVRVYQNGILIPLTEVVQYLVEKNFNETNPAKQAERAKRINELPKMVKKNETSVFKVSTGRDKFEKAGENHGNKDSWTVTPTGYYTVQHMNPKHKSEAYSSKFCDSGAGKMFSLFTKKEVCTYMEHAIFFNRGIALHKAIPGTEGQLGKKASGGCVRMPGALAEFLYDKIAKTQQAKVTKIPLFTKEGTWNGDYTFFTNSVWGKRAAWSTLVIVQNKTVL